MNVEIALKNYRCFSDEKPARLSLRGGFTAFVGVNNSGKSSLLKFFYEFRSLFQMLRAPDGSLFNALLGNRQVFNIAPSVSDINELFCNSNNRDIEIEFLFASFDPATEPILASPPQKLTLTIPRTTNQWTAKLHLADGPLAISNNLSPDFQGPYLRLGSNLKADLTPLFQTCKDLSEVLYIGPFRNTINIGTKEDYFDIKVGQAFIQTWRIFKTGSVKQQNEAIYRLTRDIERVFGFSDLEINPSDDNQNLQLFVDGRSYKLSELGTGLAQFILVLANTATKQPSYILIDEPELNLHPTLQLDFLTTLASYSRKGILFATHNLGLARASADQIYSVQKNLDDKSEVASFETTPRLSEFLGELNFSSYREMGFNKIVLVEGRHEIKTVQQFLRKYKKDHQIVLLPLGGNQLINELSEAELEEIKRISDNISALIDSERNAPDAPLEPGRAAFVDLCRRAKIGCHVLERRAIENYFPDEAVKKVKGEKYRALGLYEPLAGISPAWAKAENWRIAREMTIDDLKTTDLGEFLASL